MNTCKWLGLCLGLLFLSGSLPAADEAKIKEMILGLKGVFVKRFEFEKEGDNRKTNPESEGFFARVKEFFEDLRE